MSRSTPAPRSTWHNSIRTLVRWTDAISHSTQQTNQLRADSPASPGERVHDNDFVSTLPVSAPLTGRDVELDTLTEAAGVTTSPGPGMVLVSGDAGIGKSRLLAALGERASAAGWRVATGHCLDLGGSPLPYLPFAEIAARLQANRPEVLERLSQRWPAVRRLLAGPAETGSPEAPVDRGSFFESVYAVLDELGREAPLLVVLEDLHWADRVDLRPAQLSVHPPLHRPGLGGRHLPQRRPAPPAPAADDRRRLVPAAGRPATRARPAGRRTTYARWCGRCTRSRSSRGPAAGPCWSGPRATRSSPRSWSPPSAATTMPARPRGTAAAAARPPRTGRGQP